MQTNETPDQGPGQRARHASFSIALHRAFGWQIRALVALRSPGDEDLRPVHVWTRTDDGISVDIDGACPDAAFLEDRANIHPAHVLRSAVILSFREEWVFREMLAHSEPAASQTLDALLETWIPDFARGGALHVLSRRRPSHINHGLQGSMQQPPS